MAAGNHQSAGVGFVAYLGLGSNLGDRRANLDFAARRLGELGTLRLSPVHETDPVGPQDQGMFLNQAAELTTTLSPTELHRATRAIEAEAGREPVDQRVHWGPRVLDIDLLLYDDRVLVERGLALPHPRLHERRFVLGPLSELNPDARHPVLGKTVRELLHDLPE